MVDLSTDWLVNGVLDRLERILPAQRPIALHEPALEANAWATVKDCLASGWVSSVGTYVDRFERELAESTGIAHAIATVNGTAALHTSLLLAGVAAGDEVLLPALTFVGSANPVATIGAVPHFVDCAEDTLGIDPQALATHLEKIAEQRDDACFNRRSGRRIRALMVVHVLGHLADMAALSKIAENYGLHVIEDAAEALGSRRDGRHAGAWGVLSALSFNGNKIITTGGGGALLTADADLAQRARALTTTAKRPHPWAFEHDQVAFNYRMPNLNAALGVAQLEHLDALLAAKRHLATVYRDTFEDLEGVEVFREPATCQGNQWLNLLLLPDAVQRDALLGAAHARGLLLRPFWTPLHHLPMYTGTPRAELRTTEHLFARGVCLPSSAALAATIRAAA